MNLETNFFILLMLVFLFLPFSLR